VALVDIYNRHGHTGQKLYTCESTIAPHTAKRYFTDLPSQKVNKGRTHGPPPHESSCASFQKDTGASGHAS